jgi:lysophospholipase L1-like esterase
MKKKLYLFLKIFSSNIIIVFLCVILIELFLGYWFDKDNFGPYMREHRMKNQPIIWEQGNETIKYNYVKNYYGFRGNDIDPSKIEAIILGGSVVDEKFKPEKYTITEFLNGNLKKNKSSIQIINAGVWGQSTKGMVHGFENWLFKIKKFKPKYILIYTGINDLATETVDDINHVHDGFLLNPVKFEAFTDNIKSRSFIYDQLSIFRYKILSNVKNFVKYDGKIDEKYKKNFNFIDYSQAEQIIKKDKNKTSNYLGRIDKIYYYSKKLGAKPIFITNISAEGYVEDVFLLNTALIDHCLIKKYFCIDLAKKIDGNINYWYDGLHTTKEGSKVIADLITPELLSYFNN